MPLQVFNAKSRAVEPFETVKPNLVRMYVCGPTVYADAHAGHARSYVTYDVMRRYFLARGMDVEHVQNFTDLEESVCNRAKEEGKHPLAFADERIHSFLSDMDALRVLRADHYPRVSDHIEEIQRIIQDLVESDVAYPVDCHPGKDNGEHAYVCDIYFDVEKAPRFGSLIGQSVDELSVDGVDAKGDRRHPMDFALWKSRDDWGVTWPSPWGDGRPGWHVECTAMALKYLGPHFDLHGGGLDLVFPHHDSEQTIAEAWTSDTYVSYFLHNGFVTIDRQKMSKSKGNFVTVKDLLTRHDPEALRVFLLSAHYRAPLNYDEDAMRAAAERLAAWKGAVAALRAAANGATGDAAALAAPLCEARRAFWDSLEDDFRFDGALDALDVATERARSLSGAEAAGALAFFREAADALGILWDVESRWEAKPLPAMPARS